VQPSAAISPGLLERQGARGQVGVQLRHHLRALADRRRDALDRSGAGVPDGEHARQARFQSLAGWARRGSGHHKALGVELRARRSEPVGIGLRPDEQEQMAQRPAGLFAGASVAPGHGPQAPPFAFQARHLGMADQLDVRQRCDPVHEIARHAGLEATRPDQHAHFAHPARQEDHRLARRIAAADERDFLPRA